MVSVTVIIGFLVAFSGSSRKNNSFNIRKAFTTVSYYVDVNSAPGSLSQKSIMCTRTLVENILLSVNFAENVTSRNRVSCYI